MSNMINSKLIEILSNIDKDKLNNAQKMLQSLSKDDLNNLIGMLGKNINNTRNQK